MIPFLQPKKMSSMIVARKGNSNVEVAPEVEAPDSDHGYKLKECMTDLLGAIERKSVMDMAKAFKDAFEHLESEPHEEYEDKEGA